MLQSQKIIFRFRDSSNDPIFSKTSFDSMRLSILMPFVRISTRYILSGFSEKVVLYAIVGGVLLIKVDSMFIKGLDSVRLSIITRFPLLFFVALLIAATLSDVTSSIVMLYPSKCCSTFSLMAVYSCSFLQIIITSGNSKKE